MARNGKQCTSSSDNEPYPFFVISVPAFYKYIIGCAPPGGKSDTPEFSIEFTKSHISSMPRIKSNLCRSNLIVPDLWKTSQLCVQRQTPCFEATIKIILKKKRPWKCRLCSFFFDPRPLVFPSKLSNRGGLLRPFCCLCPLRREDSKVMR